MTNFSSVMNGESITWTIDLTSPLVHEIQGLHSVNVMDPDELVAISRDHETFVAVLYILCRDQIEARGISPAKFGESLSPELLKPAADALCSAIVDFKPEWRRNRKTREFLLSGEE
jgi:hypothetical protein